MKNTGASSIVCFTILVLPILLDEEYRTYTILDVPVSCIYNTGIPESLIYAQYRKLQYSSSNNTGNTSIVCWMKNTGASSIVCFTILVLSVLLDEEYWSFQYRVFYNTSITSIVG
jgi:hypothetical protein